MAAARPISAATNCGSNNTFALKRHLGPAAAAAILPTCKCSTTGISGSGLVRTAAGAGRRTVYRAAVQTDPSTSSSPSEPSSMSKLGQNFNAAGVGLFFRLLGGNQALAMPHLSVPDIRSIDWAALSAAGFKGVVFDKDNTLTAPFSLEVEPRLRASLAAAGAAFGGRLVLYSNSAGLQQYDPHGEEAVRLEAALGIPVLRHKEKKPAGGAAELEAHFGCLVSELVMVGDRYLTDVVFGNRHGMLTVRPEPLTRAGEPAGVVLARGVEEHFVGRWGHKGVTAPPHPLLTRAGAPLLSSFLISVPQDTPGQSQ